MIHGDGNHKLERAKNFREDHADAPAQRQGLRRIGLREKQSEFITANHVKLHYLDWGGKGKTLLFLHGLGDTAHIFDVLAPKFTNEFRVLGLTRRGHGESEIPEGGYDTETRVEDIRQFLDALKISRAMGPWQSWLQNKPDGQLVSLLLGQRRFHSTP